MTRQNSEAAGKTVLIVEDEQDVIDLLTLNLRKADGFNVITASDGAARVIGAGEVILVEDVSGKGHLSKSVEAKIRYSIFVPIEPV